jgi:hypothetical protein
MMDLFVTVAILFEQSMKELPILLGDSWSQMAQAWCAKVNSTVDCMEKVLLLLDDTGYKKLAKDLKQSVEWKTTPFIKGSSLPEDVAEQMQPHGSKPPRFYGLPKSSNQKPP